VTESILEKFVGKTFGRESLCEISKYWKESQKMPLSNTYFSKNACYHSVFMLYCKSKRREKAGDESYNFFQQTNPIDKIMQNEKLLLKQSEVLDLLSISKTTLFRWRNEGKFPEPIQLGSNTVRYKTSEVLKFAQLA
jgi:prophage regulatory protein